MCPIVLVPSLAVPLSLAVTTNIAAHRYPVVSTPVLMNMLRATKSKYYGLTQFSNVTDSLIL